MKRTIALYIVLLIFVPVFSSAQTVTITIDALPDIIIGDMESYTTVGNNLFEFTGVFAFDDIVSFSDGRSSYSMVKWSYMEYDDFSPETLQAPGQNWIEINDTDPLDDLNLIWNPPADISQTSIATFRNIKVSPPPGDSYPDPDTQYLAPEYRIIVLCATYDDGLNVTSDTEVMVVYTMDNCFDSFSPPLFPHWDDDFEDEDVSDWTWTTQDTNMLTSVSGNAGNIPGTDDYALWMTTDDTVANQGQTPAIAYGSWTSLNVTVADRISYTSGVPYTISLHLVSNNIAAVDQPGLRFRALHGTSATGADMVIQEGFSGEKHPTITSDVNYPTLIDHYWYPAQWLVDVGETAFPETAGFFIAADMWDNSASVTGACYISGVEVFEVDPLDLSEATTVFTAPPFNASDWRDTTFEGGESNTTTIFNASDGLTITYPDVGGTEFRLRFWEYVKAPGDVYVTSNTLYRMTFQITSTGNAPPVLRQRLMTAYSYMGSENIITPTFPFGSGIYFAKPGSTQRELVCYLPITDDFMDGDWLTWSMDTYGPIEEPIEDPYSGSYTLHSVTIEALPLP